eukprot:TRINITY_DN31509_c0_g1_i1.p1 TRINITY_DN31509_c0_g1~~TRINITY_DN31509_c0_g1_i1.p1  ORF type:complete len:620 (-),score=105.95 TRINITY_DN31509_c0_g1_i1:157-2016(-)
MLLTRAMRQGARQIYRSAISRPNHRPFYRTPTKPVPQYFVSTNNEAVLCNWIRPFAASPSSYSENEEILKYVGYAVLLVGCGLATYYNFPYHRYKKNKPSPLSNEPEVHTVTNWSATHEAQTRVYAQPESVEELEAMVKEAHLRDIKIRPVGSGLSPNCIGLSSEGMINLALLDKVLHVDQEKQRVTVQAGIRVSQVVDALAPHGLTLQNFASIREQQVGGITQVGAHGTGTRIPPIDEQVISMKLVTPAKGTIELSAEKDPELFHLARCGLGGLGIVAEMTLQCVPRHQLVEHTFISNIKEIRKKHKKWLAENKHLRYMWIPHTDAIVVVQCNPLADGKEPPKFTPTYERYEALQHARNLYKDLSEKYKIENTKETGDDKTNAEESDGETDIDELSFMELRDKLLALDPLNKDHVMKVNLAEAEYWKKSEGYRVGWSDEILGFDCGGQQWVSEICFPAGTLAKPTMKDVDYVQQVLQLIKTENIPAPAPIEQRWTASSRSPMSPASSKNPDDIFSWVGIIMYLPTAEANQRKEITSEFFKYRRATQKQLWDVYSAYEHWAKIEVPDDEAELAWLHERFARRFPVDLFNKLRKELDPKQILSNDVLDKLFPLPKEKVEQ